MTYKFYDTTNSVDGEMEVSIEDDEVSIAITDNSTKKWLYMNLDLDELDKLRDCLYNLKHEIAKQNLNKPTT